MLPSVARLAENKLAGPAPDWPRFCKPQMGPRAKLRRTRLSSLAFSHDLQRLDRTGGRPHDESVCHFLGGGPETCIAEARVEEARVLAADRLDLIFDEQRFHYPLEELLVVLRKLVHLLENCQQIAIFKINSSGLLGCPFNQVVACHA